MLYLTHKSTLKCRCGITLKPKPAENRSITIDGSPVLCRKDIEGAPIPNCPQAGPGITPCNKIESLLAGEAGECTSDGQNPLLSSTFLALTNGSPPGTAFADDPGQSRAQICDAGAVASAEPPTLFEPSKGKNWIEVVAADADGNPLVNRWCRIQQESGGIIDCRLDENGKRRIEGLAEETCTVTFPDSLVPVPIKPGDTLSRIAKKHYGDPKLWRRIWDHPSNSGFRDLVNHDPDKIPIGPIVMVPRPIKQRLETNKSHKVNSGETTKHIFELEIDQPPHFYDNEGNEVRKIRGIWHLTADPLSPIFNFKSGAKPDLVPINPNSEYERLMKDCREVMREQQELSLDLRGDAKVWFATVYYWVTKYELDAIEAGTYLYPHMKLLEVIGFHETYKHNLNAWRSGYADGVEENWKKAFSIAEEVDSTWYLLRSSEIKYALLPSMEAHIRFDLPRAIADAYVRRYSKRNNATLDDFRPDFEAMAPVFDQATARMNEQMEVETWWFDLGDYETVRTLGFPFLFHVPLARKHAWEKAEVIVRNYRESPEEIQRQIRANQVARHPMQSTLDVAGEEVASYDWRGQPVQASTRTRHPGVRTPRNSLRLVRDDGGYDQTIRIADAVRKGGKLVIRFQGLVPSGRYSLYTSNAASAPGAPVFTGVAFKELTKKGKE